MRDVGKCGLVGGWSEYLGRLSQMIEIVPWEDNSSQLQVGISRRETPT